MKQRLATLPKNNCKLYGSMPEMLKILFLIKSTYIQGVEASFEYVLKNVPKLLNPTSPNFSELCTNALCLI